MNNLINKIKKKRLASTLDKFLDQTNSNDLDGEESLKNLEENLIELIHYGNHSSNGLLFTKNGYFLTAKHCVDNLKGLRVRTNNGRMYGIKKICAVSHKSDIAIAKINLPRNIIPKRFNIYNTDELEKTPIILLTRKNGKIQENYGLISRDWSPQYSLDKLNLFSLFISTKPGDSGGIIISPNGELIGIHSGKDNSHNRYCIKINRVLDLIEFYKNKKNK